MPAILIMLQIGAALAAATASLTWWRAASATLPNFGQLTRDSPASEQIALIATWAKQTAEFNQYAALWISVSALLLAIATFAQIFRGEPPVVSGKEKKRKAVFR